MWPFFTKDYNDFIWTMVTRCSLFRRIWPTKRNNLALNQQYIKQKYVSVSNIKKYKIYFFFCRRERARERERASFPSVYSTLSKLFKKFFYFDFFIKIFFVEERFFYIFKK